MSGESSAGADGQAGQRKAPPPGTESRPSTRRACLRLEFISERQTRCILFIQRATGLVAWGLLLWEFLAQETSDSNSLLRGVLLETSNICMASVCLALLLGVAVWFGSRILEAWRAGTVWGFRRKYLLVTTGAEILIQLINLAAFLAMNVYSYVKPCGWFDPAAVVLSLASWTCWDTLLFLNVSRPLLLLPSGSWQRLHQRLRRWWAQRRCRIWRCGSSDSGTSTMHPTGKQRQQQEGEDMLGTHPTPITLDLPARKLDVQMAVWVHLVAFVLLFVPMEVLTLLTTMGTLGVFGAQDYRTINVQPGASDCREQAYLHGDCTMQGPYAVMALVVGGIVILQVLVFLVLMMLVLSEYKRLPYAPYRVMNVAARLTMRTRISTCVFFIASISLIYYINIDNCNANIELWLGIGPMYIAMTTLLLAEALLYSPSPPQQAAVKLHSSLQQFSWTEAGAPAVLAKRGHPSEPLFCFETALKACYFCLHSYRHFRPESTVSSLQTALALYGCMHYEWLREPQLDMNCLLCWGPDTLVIAFRGTQSLANIKADAKFWRSPHPPQRGVVMLGSRPLIHTGFLASWVDHGLNQQVLQRVRQVLEGRQHAAMEPFGTTVVRCCSQEHEERGAELEAAAAAARASEAAASGMAGYGEGGGGDLGGSASGGSEEWECLNHKALATAAAAATAVLPVDEEAAAAVVSAVMQGGQEAAAALLSAVGGGAGRDNTSNGAAVQPDNGASPAGPSGSALAAGGSCSGSRQTPFRVLITGHSLGGAVGTLCAHDLARLLPEWGHTTVVSPASSATFSEAVLSPAAAAAGGQAGEEGAAADALASSGRAAAAPTLVAVQCYTFGAPRTGNHAFAAELKRMVPDSWAVINDQDLVAKSAKFLVLFKRPGHVCIVNPRGDLIVNPSFLESNVQRSSYRASISQHLLLSYNQSFAAILRSQHEGKGLSGGAEAVALLAANPAVRELLVRPLAIRHASLRRYIQRSAADKQEDAATLAAAPQVVVVSSVPGARPGTAPGDLDGYHCEEEQGEADEMQRQSTIPGMPRLVSALSTVASMAFESYKV